ncbi:enolase C-terminal domain-like protein [Kribbella sp. CA-245084]|uniref:enolase C-terminal domain-like protein n=1 Tax=Kribbella sp. CA-245084 TaxID=3239940 RepID=UPI003D8C5C74
MDEQRVSSPMSWFAPYAERRSSWRGPGADLVWVWIETDQPDVFGIGQSRGGAVTAALIEQHLSTLLVGNNALEVIRRTEELRRATLPYAAGGIASMGVSACELALWDLNARSAGVPLVRLLGGSSTPLPFYLTAAGVEALDGIEESTLRAAELVKRPARFGPADGQDGFRANLNDLATLRERLPDGVGIAVDCFMSWDVPYAAEFAQAAAGFGLVWIEEPLPPNDLEGYAELRRRTSPVRIAGGEHVFGLRDGLRLIDGRCADVLQIDVTWCGGLRIAATLGAVAQDHGLRFAPHAAATQPWALHLLGAAGPGALAEIVVGLGTGGVTRPAPGTTPGVGIEPASVGFS